MIPAEHAHRMVDDLAAESINWDIAGGPTTAAARASVAMTVRVLRLHSSITEHGQVTEITRVLVVPAEWIDDASRRDLLMTQVRNLRDRTLPPKAHDMPALDWIEEWSASDSVTGEWTLLEWP